MANGTRIRKAWNIEDTRKLIRGVKFYTFLYDRSDPLYMDEMAEAKAFASIVKILDDFDVDSCKKRWDYIFKQMASKSLYLWDHLKGLEEFTDDLHFLTEHVTPGRTKSNVEPQKIVVNAAEYKVPNPIVSITSNEGFFRNLAAEVSELRPDLQSTFKIFVLNKLHEFMHLVR